MYFDPEGSKAAADHRIETSREGLSISLMRFIISMFLALLSVLRTVVTWPFKVLRRRKRVNRMRMFLSGESDDL